VTRHVGVIVFVVNSWPASVQPLLAQQTSDLPPGWVTPTPIGLFAEPTAMKKLINATDGLVGDADGRDGPYAELGHMITGAGWTVTGNYLAWGSAAGPVIQLGSADAIGAGTSHAIISGNDL